MSIYAHIYFIISVALMCEFMCEKMRNNILHNGNNADTHSTKCLIE